jgi:cytochrome c5
MYEDPNPVATIPASASNPATGPRQLPVGIAHSSGDFGTADDPADAVAVYSFTCGACHFKKMDDGNYAVGIGNTEYDYARMIAAQGQLPLSTLLGIQGDAYDPDGLKATLADAVAASNAKYGQDAAKNAFLSEVNPVIVAGSQPEDLSSIQATEEEQKRNWVTWTGVIDFLVRPMQDDGIHGMTRIMNTSSIPSDEHVLRQHGFRQHAGMSWNGGAYDLIQFIRGFIAITPSDPVNPESRDEYNYWVKEYRYMPLVRYLETMDEPELPTDRTFDVAAAKRGEQIFDDHCTVCHNGPGGETARPYAHGEIRVEATHADIMNPWWDPTAFDGAGGWENGIPLIAERFPAGTSGEITRKVKAPRFISMWDNQRLLHNGSVGSLEELLTCEIYRTSYAQVIPTAENPNPTLEDHFSDHPMFANSGHEFGCHFSAQDKADLVTFIETFKSHRNVLNKYNGQFDTPCHTNANGTSRQVTLEFRDGRHMDLFTKYFSDANCSVFNKNAINNPWPGLSWEMALVNTFTNSRGYESHTVLYSKPDGTSETGTIALEEGQLANATSGDPQPTGMFARLREDYPGINGVWLNNQCAADNTRDMIVFRDLYRIDWLVTYNGPDCSGGVASRVQTGAWSFDDPEWVQAGIKLQNNAKYNMRIRMKALDGSGKTTQFLNKWGNNLTTSSNNYYVSRVSGTRKEYSRIWNVISAE